MPRAGPQKVCNMLLFLGGSSFSWFVLGICNKWHKPILLVISISLLLSCLLVTGKKEAACPALFLFEQNALSPKAWYQQGVSSTASFNAHNNSIKWGERPFSGSRSLEKLEGLTGSLLFVISFIIKIQSFDTYISMFFSKTSSLPFRSNALFLELS